VPKIKTAVFPIAGLGTRFLPATKAIPKEMLIVVDKPLIQYAVEEAKEAGIERFIFVTSQGKTAIEDHFDKSIVLERMLMDRKKDNEVKRLQELQLEPGQAIYIRQQSPLGLGHAVACAKNLIDEDAFAVVLADDLVLGPKGCLRQMVDAYNTADGHMIAVLNIDREDTSRYGVLDIDSQIDKKIKAKNIIEKPQPAHAPSTIAVSGRYILRSTIFDSLAHIANGINDEIQLTDALQKTIKSTPVTGFLYDGFRYDCGTKSGWLEANIAFSLKNPETFEETKKMLQRFI
jgi:UTP--glucose-1-phosphate uridylyltransferase